VREHPSDADDQSLLWDCDRDVLRRHGPHFHARHADGAAKVRIDTLEPIETTLGRRQLRLVLAWAELHQAELLENWRLARAGETLSEIEPLQ
jgi:hypothetical protein